MYVVTLVNQSHVTWTGSDGARIAPGGTWQTGAIGNAWVKSDQMGTLNFLDIADMHIPGDTGETWGVLISYQGEDFVGRYEGGGKLHVTITNIMQVQLSGMDLRQMDLPPIVLA